MRELLAKDKEILRLRNELGLTFEECAQRLRLTNGAAQNRFKAATRRAEEIARSEKLRERKADNPLTLTIDEMPMSVRLRTALRNAEILSLKQITELTTMEFKKIKGAGPGLLEEAVELLADYSQRFARVSKRPRPPAPKRYWLTSWSVQTWREFLVAGGNIYGLPELYERSVTEMVNVGDVLICYMRQVYDFFAVLEVTEGAQYNSRQIWSEEIYPVRLGVKVVIRPRQGVAVLSLRGQLSLFRRLKNPKIWGNHFHTSIKRWTLEDATIVIDQLKALPSFGENGQVEQAAKRASRVKLEKE